MRIGRRTQVTDLRSIWPTEPDFSDWLVQDDGLALIAEDIGIIVEDAKRESRPGDYPADIVGHALGDEKHIIVIENQFGKTNHDHLGKLLTYAAMHSAMTGVWISEHVSPDHRKVVDWLNDNTPSHVSFFLAQLKAYKIGDSPVAPQLDVLCRPNIQAKLRRAEDDTQLTEIKAWREKSWEEILSYIADKNPPFRVQSPSDDHWSNIAVGRSDFWIGLTLVPKNKRIGCELAMSVSWKKDAFAQLLSQRQAIEAEIGATLDWREMVDRRSARILLEANTDPKDPNNKEIVKQWMYEKSLAFYRAFHERVRLLQPSVPIYDESTVRPSDEPRSLRMTSEKIARLPNRRDILQVEGGSVSLAEEADKFYVITDQCAMRDILDEEDQDWASIDVTVFDTEGERTAYLRQRGWLATLQEQDRARLI